MRRLREVTWALGAPVRVALIGLIRLYRLSLAGWMGGQCRFYPSCSHYAEEAIRVHGAARGSALAGWRIARCGPFTDGGVDHVPPAQRAHPKYEVVIPQGGDG
jgi:putative membrane protein insertion efficiency factor